MRYYYTDAELKKILDDITILTDTREQKNAHITNYFDEKLIAHKSKALQVGDYSVYLPRVPELIDRPVYYDRCIAVERKANLDELAGNFTRERERIKNEFARASNMRLFLMIEDSTFEDLIKGNYRSQYKPSAFAASLLSMEAEYNLKIMFLKRQYSGYFIHMVLRHYVRLTLLERIGKGG